MVTIKNTHKLYIAVFLAISGMNLNSSYARSISSSDVTPPKFQCIAEKIGDREKMKITLTVSDESGVKEFRDFNGDIISGTTYTKEFSKRGEYTFTAIDNNNNENSYTLDLNWINPCIKSVIGVELEGSGYWSSSNFREWLNSDLKNVGYTGNSPSNSNMDGHGYDLEPGFLNQFTEEEKNAIAITERRVIVPSMYAKARDGGSDNLPHANNLGGTPLANYAGHFMLNYKNYGYKSELDKVFLLNNAELYWYLYRRDFSFSKDLTNEAQIKNNTTSKFDWWIQSSSPWRDYEWLYSTSKDSYLVNQYASKKLGVVPCINIKPNYIFENGKQARDLKIGENIHFGTYLNAPIEWQVINISDEGFPLLISTKILDLKKFDAKGDYPRMYSDHINFNSSDISMLNDIDFKSTTGLDDINIPVLEIVDDSVLKIRHNEAYSVDFNAYDLDSGLEYVILPNGEKITESTFAYTFDKNEIYTFKLKDIAGNFTEVSVPVGNINQNAELTIKSNTPDWSNNVKVDIRSSNNVKVEKNNFLITNEKSYSAGNFPNYISYNNAKFKLSGRAKLLSYTDLARGEDLGLGFYYENLGKNEFSYTLTGKWLNTAYKIKIDDLINAPNNELYFETTFTVPDDYSQDLQTFIQASLTDSVGKVFNIDLDVKYEIIDDSSFAINSIILPDGTSVENVKSYVDTIESEGVQTLTYKVVDNRGVITEKSIVVKVDKTKPLLNLEYDKDDILNKQYMDVKIKASDELSGLKHILLPDGTAINKSDSIFRIESDGVYEFISEDIAGNISKEQILVSGIDEFVDSEEMVSQAEMNQDLISMSIARDLVNKLPESSKKEELQDRLNGISPIESFTKISHSNNLDLYIKTENMLGLSINTNSITFEDFSGAEDMVKRNSINLTVNSSLPYEINAYLPREIENADKNSSLDKHILNIKVNSEADYKEFIDVNTKLQLLDNQSPGNNKIHGVDIKLKGGIAHKKDNYKATIKFEINQK